MKPNPAITIFTNLRNTWHNPRTPTLARALLVAGVIYVLLPFDLIPDVIPVLGWLDDLAVLPLAVAVFQKWSSIRRRESA